MENSDLATKADLKVLGDDLRGEMTAMRSELRGEMTALRDDMTALRSELRGEMTALRDDLKADMTALRDDLTELVRDTETKLLKAFYSFAEAIPIRITAGEKATAGVAERLAIVERRVTDIEKHLNFPQAS